ncbi:MAG: diguanylate cyclase, partial [Actinobacteria bacterium]|nr:diguanylate cyclase [Actinomycetota bacterium]
MAPRAVVLVSALAGSVWALAIDHTTRYPGMAAAGCVAAAIWSWARPSMEPEQARVFGTASAFLWALLLVGLQGGAHSPLVAVWLAIVAGECMGAQQPGAVAALEAFGSIVGLLAAPSLDLIPLVAGFFGVASGTYVSSRLVRAELRRVQAQADSDPLTGLANRWSIDRHLASLLRGARTARIAVFAIDLDDFRTINREHGHDAGDRAIVVAAARMREALPEAALARLGGDEFLVVMDGKFDPPTVARRLCDAVAAAPIEGRTLTASIGVAWTPEHGTTWEELRKAADDALRAAKASGKSRALVYSGESLDDPYEAVQALWREDRIRIVVQPVVELTTGTVRAYEALARFAVDGDGSPLRWFRLAGRAGLRAELEIACLERALEVAAGRPQGTRFAINLSPETLERDEARRLLEQHGDLKGLILELTENGVVEDYERLQVRLEPLYERGLALAV